MISRLDPRPTARRLLAAPPVNYAVTRIARRLLPRSGWLADLAARHLFPIGTVRAALPEGQALVLWTRADDGTANHVFWGGWAGYEPATAPIFYRLARRAALTLDIGANVGFYALLAGHANPAGRVHAFEPGAAALARLRRHVALNRLTNVEVHAAAVGADPGAAELFVGEAGVPMAASLSAAHAERARQAGVGTPRDAVEAVRVPVVSIDQVVAERALPRVDLVKIDVEGAEVEVIRGMGATLGRDRPALICEVVEGSGTAGELKRLLDPLGYRPYYLTVDGPVPVASISERHHEEPSNYLFTPLAAEELAQL